MKRGATLDEIEALYRSDLESFLRVAAAILGSREAAREAVQEGFAVAVRKRRSYTGRGPLAAWLWTVVLNTARNRRRERRPATFELTENLAAPSPKSDVDGRLEAALSSLSERQRLVVFLHYYADLDYATIATALGIEMGTVGATLSAARAALRSQLTEVST
jgi:RNA polymerase sigma-70 factor, ECF subfamily